MLIMLILVVILVIAGAEYFGYIDSTLIAMGVLISIIPAVVIGFVVSFLLIDHVPLATESTEIQLHELPEDTRFIQVDATDGKSIVVYCIEEDGEKKISEVDASKATFVEIESDGEAKLVSSKSSYPWYINMLFYRTPIKSWEFYLPAR